MPWTYRALPEVVYTDQDIAYLHLNGVIVADNESGELRYLLPDGLGSVRQALDEGGQPVSYYEFDPYGNPVDTTGGGDPYGYTGEWWDSATELLHLRARWYQPETGIFLSKDPWGGDIYQSQTLNGWSYVQGNPILRIDPSGLKAIIPWDQYYTWVFQNPYNGPAQSGLGYTPMDIIDDIGNTLPDVAKQALDIVIANFEGAPVSDPQNPCEEPNVTNNSPNDVVAYTTQDIFPSRDYNRYDWLISGWADYWK